MAAPLPSVFSVLCRRLGPPVVIAGLIVAAVAAGRFGTLLTVGGKTPLADAPVRFGVAGALALAALLLAVILPMRRRRAGPGTLEASADPAGDAVRDLRRRAVAAMHRLGIRRSAWRPAGGAAYRKPCYLVLGASGSGKSALIEALGGVADDDAPPRAAAWRFADDAVFVDTTGDCAVPDSRSDADGPAWSALLSAMKAMRPRRPVNGILLVLSIPDLVAWNAIERRVHAQAIRRRLIEARRRLGVRLPVHIVCTKADRIAGFGAFFDSLTDDERRQVWGMVFPAEDAAPPPVGERVATVFATLVGRLDGRLLGRLNQEPDIRVRAAAFGFPLQVAALEERLADLLGVAWADELGFEPPLLRSLYLTSARTGAGEAVDALSLGLPPPPDPAVAENASAPCFLDRFKPDILLPEADLVGEDRTLARIRRIRRALAFAAMVVGAFALAGFWARSYHGNLALIQRTDEAVARVEEALRQFDTPPRSLNKVEDTDFAALLPVLDAMRDLPAGYAERDRWPPLALTGGLYQGSTLGRAGEAMYARALRSLFLSRILLRVEDVMRVSWLRPDDLQSALRAYLMLGGRLPLDRAHLSAWLAADWAKLMPGPEAEAKRQALAGHLTALFDLSFAPVPLDDALVNRALKTLEEETTGRGVSSPG